MHLFLDFETRSRYDLKKIGMSRYTKSLHALLCLAYQIGDEPLQLWTPLQDAPRDLFLAIELGYELHAYNAGFERAVWDNHCVPQLGWPEVDPSQWYCTAAQAATAALPRGLGNCGKTLNTRVKKDEQGKLVMLQLSKPRRPSKNNPSEWYTDPDKFQILYDYCKDDVRAERAIDSATPRLSESERKLWLLDQTINNRGVPVDLNLATAAIDVWSRQSKLLNASLAKLTDNQVTSANQISKLKNWVIAQGIECGKSLDAAAIQKLLCRKDLPAKVRKALRIRKELGLASIKKYHRMRDVADDDGRVRGCHMYHGATTGRWAGRLVQFQNVKRTRLDEEEINNAIELVMAEDVDMINLLYPSVGGLLSGLLRPTVAAPPGKKLIVCDFAAIEARGVAWLAGQKDRLEQYAAGEDLYKHMATKIYGVELEEVTKQQRQLAKVTVLGCGYGMGAKTFLATCQNWGLSFVDQELAELAVNTYREANPKIKHFWRGIGDAAVRAVEKPGTIQRYRGVKFAVNYRWLWCVLPSKRCIAYYKPFLQDRALPSPPYPKDTKRPAVHFTGINPTTGQPQIQSTYGAKIVENICQAVCRDLLAESMFRLEDAGYPVVMHVHDEVVCEVDDTPVKNINEVEEIMRVVPSWADGFPIEVDGFEGKRYRK